MKTDYTMPLNQRKIEMDDPVELAIYALHFLQCNMDKDLVSDINQVDDADESDIDRFQVLIDDAMNHLASFKEGKKTKTKQKKQEKVKKKNIDPEQFVIAYLECSTVQELAQKLNIHTVSVYEMCRELTAAGVDLPPLKDEAVNH